METRLEGALIWLRHARDYIEQVQYDFGLEDDGTLSEINEFLGED